MSSPTLLPARALLESRVALGCLELPEADVRGPREGAVMGVCVVDESRRAVGSESSEYREVEGYEVALSVNGSELAPVVPDTLVYGPCACESVVEVLESVCDSGGRVVLPGVLPSPSRGECAGDHFDGKACTCVDSCRSVDAPPSVLGPLRASCAISEDAGVDECTEGK